MLWHVIGFAGMACVVLAYWMNVSQRWEHCSPRYLWTNLVGAVLLIISLCFHFNLGSFVIEVFWISISIHGLVKNRAKSP